MKTRFKKVQSSRIHSEKTGHLNQPKFASDIPQYFLYRPPERVFKYRKWFFGTALQKMVQKLKRATKMYKVQKFILKQPVIGINQNSLQRERRDIALKS